MDALEIARAIVGGFDWGARTADIVAALWPQRCKALVAVSGYLIGSLETNQQPLPPEAELGWWYQYYFATERAGLGYRRNTHDFNKLIWRLASPTWDFDDATFDRTAAAFENPDHVDIVIHNYRWRLGLAEGEKRYRGLEHELAGAPPSRYRRSRSAATSTARKATARHTPSGSPAHTSTRSLTASATTFPRRRRQPSPEPSSSSHSRIPPTQESTIPSNRTSS